MRMLRWIIGVTKGQRERNENVEWIIGVTIGNRER